MNYYNIYFKGQKLNNRPINEDDLNKLAFWKSKNTKYYNIAIGENTDYFGFPAGELPTWAPKIALDLQWEKTIITPINRFLEVMNIPLANSSGSIQLTLFDI